MPQKQKAQNKVSRNKTKPLKRAALFGVLIIVAILVWPLIRNDSFYSTNKDDAMIHLKSTISDIEAPGASIYSNVRDIGCDSRNSVGLASFVHCELVGESYYKGQGNVKSGLDILNKKLKQEGWSESFYSNDDNVQRAIAVSRGEQSGSRPYKNADKQAHLIFYFESFDESKYIKNYAIQQLIDNKKIARPTSDEFIYGVYITKTYWTCRSDSLFKLPCPIPPTKPE